MRTLAHALHEYWVDRYNRQLPRAFSKAMVDPTPFQQKLGRTFADLTESPLPEEKDDDTVFRDLVFLQDLALGFKALREIQDMQIKMYEDYKKVDWSD